MVYILIAAWIFSGVLGAYIGHRFADHSYSDTHLKTVFVMAFFGPVTFVAASGTAIQQWLTYSKVMNKVVFKARD